MDSPFSCNLGERTIPFYKLYFGLTLYLEYIYILYHKFCLIFAFVPVLKNTSLDVITQIHSSTALYAPPFFISIIIILIIWHFAIFSLQKDGNWNDFKTDSSALLFNCCKCVLTEHTSSYPLLRVLLFLKSCDFISPHLHPGTHVLFIIYQQFGLQV